MSIFAADPLPPLSPLPPKRGQAWLAWLVIVLAIVFEVGYEPLAARLSHKYATRLQESDERAYFTELQFQGREIVGMVRDFHQLPSTFEPQIQEGLTQGPYEQRLCFVVLVGELQGPAAALKQLDTIQKMGWEQRPPTTEETELANILERLYRAEQIRRAAALMGGGLVQAAEQLARGDGEESGIASTLSETERHELHTKLRWFGDLALAPEHDSAPAVRAAVLALAWQSALAALLMAVVVLFVAILGFLLLTAGIILIRARLVWPRFMPGSRDGGVYAETFALWMVVFMVMHFAGGYIPAGKSRMLLAGLFSLSSLLVLGWPVLRGVAWRRVGQDIGWWKPGRTVVELLWGIGCYLATFPLLLLAVALSLGLLSLYNRFVGQDPFSVPTRPTHPITEMLVEGSWWLKVQIFLVAAVCAPIVEETMFRGVLYRHVREVGAKWPRLLSVLFSCLVVSFVFAVIHPQGFFGIPMLMALAIGFSVTRELRGSLFGCMAAHGLNNALVTLLTLFMN